MVVPETKKRDSLARHVLFMSTPALWTEWPFLPVIRRKNGTMELGVMFDARGSLDITGYSSTVFLTDMFGMPEQLRAFLTQPRETYDSTDEIVAAGWRVD